MQTFSTRRHRTHRTFSGPWDAGHSSLQSDPALSLLDTHAGCLAAEPIAGKTPKPAQTSHAERSLDCHCGVALTAERAGPAYPSPCCAFRLCHELRPVPHMVSTATLPKEAHYLDSLTSTPNAHQSCPTALTMTSCNHNAHLRCSETSLTPHPPSFPFLLMACVCVSLQPLSNDHH